jgi:hypothetical protein
LPRSGELESESRNPRVVPRGGNASNKERLLISSTLGANARDREGSSNNRVKSGYEHQGTQAVSDSQHVSIEKLGR